LIRAVLRRTGGNQSKAARLLRLPNQAQLRKMMLGEIGDTPAMRAALLRAKKRAARAWSLEREAAQQPALCLDQVRAELRSIVRRLEAIQHLLQGHDSTEATGM
jgi:hypothetical protein